MKALYCFGQESGVLVLGGAGLAVLHCSTPRAGVLVVAFAWADIRDVALACVHWENRQRSYWEDTGRR